MLKSFDSYVIALLKLMDDLPGRHGKSSDILASFGEYYHDEIPSAHHHKYSNGRVQWIVRTQWARQKALDVQLLDSPARGIWRMTDKGHRWLEEHPHATRLEDVESKRLSDPSDEADGESGLNYKSRLSFVKSSLESTIPQVLQSQEFKIDVRNDRLYIKIRSIRKCHYEIRLHADYNEIALHFQSSKPELNQALLRIFESHLASITARLRNEIDQIEQKSSGSSLALFGAKYDLIVRADTWGPDSIWGRVWIKLPNELSSTKYFLGETIVALKLIEATWDIFKSGYDSVHNGIAPVAKAEKADGYYVLLDRQVEAIHDFLGGRSDSLPSDEKLSDWVQFCYSFELFKEGMELFRLVLPENVNPWYFERTRKLARICEMKARG